MSIVGNAVISDLKSQRRHSNLDFEPLALVRVGPLFNPFSGLITQRFFLLIGSASAGSVLDSDNPETLSCMDWVSSRPRPRDGAKLPEHRRRVMLRRE